MVLGILAGGRRPVAVVAPGRLFAASAGQSAEIEGLSTTGASCASSSPAIASHSAAASFPADELASAMAGMAAAISTASSGRASQISLQREQRTVRPAAPKVARLMA